MSNITAESLNRFHRSGWKGRASRSSSWGCSVFLVVTGLCSLTFYFNHSGASTYSDSRQDSADHHQSVLLANANDNSNKNSNIELVQRHDLPRPAATQACKLRDHKRYNAFELNIKGPNSTITANCLSFNCTKNTIKCDNTLPTNYDGSEPPCCTHILRDMARTFDDAMCSLGLDYTASFGTLLGLTRSDRFIPWSIDIDYILRSKRVANAMVDLWDTKKTGMAHVFQIIPRMCATAEFGEGKLQKWAIPPATQNITQLDNMGLPYIDLYVGKNKGSREFSEFWSCVHKASDVWPSKRVSVYEKTMFQRIPANTEQMLLTYYGPNWRTPDKQQNPHGKGEPCQWLGTYEDFDGPGWE